MIGFGAGFAFSVLLTLGLAFIGEYLSNLFSIPQTINTAIGFFVLIAPILLPGLGVALGLIYSFKQKEN